MWQAWHLVTSSSHWHLVTCTATLCVAGVALGDIQRHFAWHLRFAWRAWRLWHWAGSGGALGLRLVAGDAATLCVAGVALGDSDLRFAWQAWRLETSTFVLRGRRGTWRHQPALVARLGWDWSPAMARHFAWQAWHLATSTFVSRGRRGTWRHLPSFSSFTHRFVAHHLSHTTFTHNFHTQLSHTTFTHNFHTQLSHTHTTFTHTHTTFTHTHTHTTFTHTQLSHTHTQLSHTHNFHTHTHTQLSHTHNLHTHTTFTHTHNFHTTFTHTHTPTHTHTSPRWFEGRGVLTLRVPHNRFGYLFAGTELHTNSLPALVSFAVAGAALIGQL